MSRHKADGKHPGNDPETRAETPAPSQTALEELQRQERADLMRAIAESVDASVFRSPLSEALKWPPAPRPSGDIVLQFHRTAITFEIPAIEHERAVRFVRKIIETR